MSLERIELILSTLYDANGYVTAKQLAQITGCSVRTVRNDLLSAKGLVGHYGEAQLFSKSNKGYCLVISEREWSSLWSDLKHGTLYPENTEIDAKHYILLALLNDSMIQISTLADHLYLSYNNTLPFLEQAEHWLADQGISLLRVRGKGVKITANPHQIRMAKWNLNSQLFITQPDHEGSLFFGSLDPIGIQKAINHIEHAFCFHFSYLSYRRLVFLLALVVLDQRRKKIYDKHYPEFGGRNWYEPIARICKEQIDAYYGTTLPEGELNFLSFAFASSEILGFTTLEAEAAFVAANRETEDVSRSVISFISGILKTDLSQDAILQSGVRNYLCAVRFDLKYGYPLQTEQSSHQSMYHYSTYIACWAACPLLESAFGTPVTGSQIAAISEHFASAIERQNTTASVYVVCSFGVGTSRLMCEQLRQTFPKLRIVDVLTPRDLGRLRTNTEIDFVVSTVPIDASLYKGDVLQIGNMLTQQDILKIQNELAYVCKNKMQTLLPQSRASSYPLFDEDLVFWFGSGTDKDTVIQTICSTLLQKGYIYAPFQASLLEREEVSSSILSSMVAIPHGLPEYVKVPKIAVAFLDEPLLWNKHGKVNIVFLLALNLTAMPGVKDTVRAFYAALITLLDNPDLLNRFRQSESPADLIGFLEGLSVE